jgi:hypothetical protein
VFLLFIIPIIYLYSYQDPNHHQQNLTHCIQQVFAEFVFSKKALADFAEEAEHGWWVGLSKYEKVGNGVGWDSQTWGVMILLGR